MLIEQNFELRGPGPPGRICTSITGCFHDKTKISEENIRLDCYLLLNYCCCCCCCGAYLSSCHRTASDANLLDDPHTFHYQVYFVIGGIRTCLGVSDDPMFLWISSNSCPLNLLLVRSHQAEIIIVKRLIQGRNSVTRVRVEPGSFDQGRRKNDAFTYSATLPKAMYFTSLYLGQITYTI